MASFDDSRYQFSGSGTTAEPEPKDTDLTHDSPHHTLGRGATQAAPGNHKHDIDEIAGADSLIALSDSLPIVPSGTGAAGSGSSASRFDHVHPAPPGISLGASIPPADAGSGSVGVSGSAARADHQHPNHVATSAANADTVDGQHFAWSDRGTVPTYLWGISTNSDSYLVTSARFALAGHTHNPSASGISVLTHNFGTLTAGQQKTQSFARSNDQYPVVSVSHPSTYIIAVISSMTSGAFSVEVRNSTAGTDHTNVQVIIHLVRAA
jgi:hypothetical protein